MAKRKRCDHDIEDHAHVVDLIDDSVCVGFTCRLCGENGYIDIDGITERIRWNDEHDEKPEDMASLEEPQPKAR